MTQLTPGGHRIVADQAARHGVGKDTIVTLLAALQHGGNHAQFTIVELGGMGQWQQGGMIMVGDMFNNDLKARVDAICNDLVAALRCSRIFADDAAENHQNWPADLGQPSAQGTRNGMAYALFPATNRLVVRQAGQTTLYDTTGHTVIGFGQSQGDRQTLTFTSQLGSQHLSTLPIIT